MAGLSIDGTNAGQIVAATFYYRVAMNEGAPVDGFRTLMPGARALNLSLTLAGADTAGLVNGEQHQIAADIAGIGHVAGTFRLNILSGTRAKPTLLFGSDGEFVVSPIVAASARRPAAPPADAPAGGQG